MKRLAKGFTLIELMIVVAIIGILAAIAIPNFVKYQLRSKFSEGATNVEGLRKAEEALRQGERRITIDNAIHSAYTPGQYWNLGGGNFPANRGGSQKTAWSTDELKTAQAMDWMVEGSTYFQYAVGVAGGTANGESGIAWSAGAVADIDGDGTVGGVVLVRPSLNDANVQGGVPFGLGFPGNVGSCTDANSQPVYGMPCTVTGPDVF